MKSLREKLLFYLVFFALGVVSVWLQVFFSREFLAVFGGSELVIGMILFWWLIFIGIGSLLPAPNKCQGRVILILSYFLLVISYLGAFAAIKIIPGFLAVAGEVIPLSWVFFILPTVLLPVCILLGWQFKLATKFFAAGLLVTKHQQPAESNGLLVGTPIGSGVSGTAISVNKAYLTEIASFVIGGLVFNFLFIEVATVLLLWFFTVLFLLAVFLITFLLRQKTAFLFFLILVLSLALLGWRLDWVEIEKKTLQPQYKFQQVLLSENSQYNKITITKSGEQINFFTNGNLLNPGSAKENEETAWLSILAAAEPKKVLVIGNGWSGIISELLKMAKIEQVVYLEPDEKLFNKLTIYNPDLFLAFSDPRFEYINSDPVRFFQKFHLAFSNDRQKKQDENLNLAKKFDLAIISQPPPSTLALNRFYTQEFFALIKKHLKAGGILAITLPGLAENIFNETQNKFVGLIYTTLKSEFKNVKVLPLERNYFLASDSEINAKMIVENFNELKTETKFLSAKYLDYVFNNEKTTQFNKNIASAKSGINKNLAPRAVVDYLIFQLQLQNLKLSQTIGWISAHRAGILMVMSLILLVALGVAKKKSENFRFYSAVALASGSLMVGEISIILLWQTWLGNVYSQIALLLSLIMLGLFLGNLTIIKAGIYSSKLLKKIQRFFWLVLASFILAINLAVSWPQVVLAIYAILFGFFTGLIFPLVNKLYLDSVTDAEKKTGHIYGVELVGTAVLILVFSLFLLPMFGFNVSLVWLLFLNLVALI